MGEKRRGFGLCLTVLFLAGLMVPLTIAHASFATRVEARQAIFEFIEVWYNRQRRHSALGYLSPLAFEALPC